MDQILVRKSFLKLSDRFEHPNGLPVLTLKHAGMATADKQVSGYPSPLLETQHIMINPARGDTVNVSVLGLDILLKCEPAADK